MTAENAQQVGLFQAKYSIAAAAGTAPVLLIAVTVNTVDKTINGAARLTQHAPQYELRADLHGSYMQADLSRGPHISVSLLGYPPLHLPPGSGIGPVLMPCLDLRLSLALDWRSGTASYRYQGPEGKWFDVPAAAVTLA